MLHDIVEYLRCPHCGEALTADDRALGCARGHSFDIARQGYASLLQPDAHTSTGDTAAMVQARQEFLGAGHYDAITHSVAEAAAGAAPGCIVDVGAGTGHYLARVLDVLDDRVGLALDVSKPALRRAARAHPRIGAVACDAWRALPVASEVAGAMLSVFAPRNGPEIRRVLAPRGRLVVATPSDRHLAELVGALDLLTVDERKQERLEDKLDPFLSLVDERRSERLLSLGHGEVEALVAMGPSARHHDPTAMAERIRALPEPMAVTVSVRVAVYQRD